MSQLLGQLAVLAQGPETQDPRTAALPDLAGITDDHKLPFRVQFSEAGKAAGTFSILQRQKDQGDEGWLLLQPVTAAATKRAPGIVKNREAFHDSIVGFLKRLETEVTANPGR